MKDRYDVIVVGSGLAGLASALILAKEGKSVCVLEKNNQFGGNLQTFVRNKTIFDTGVHYIGGLSEGENLYQYFNYLGILDGLDLQRLDMDGFDVVSFDGDEKEYHHAQGYDRFITRLVQDFPHEEEGIRRYCEALRDVCDKFPLYRLKAGKPYYENTGLFEINAKEFIASLVDDPTLRAVLAGTNLLYAGIGEKTPFYVHALTINSYIESAYRCANGGSQITRLLVKQLRAHGGDIFKHADVVDLEHDGTKLVAAHTRDGAEYKGDLFISGIDPKLTVDLVGHSHFRKAYVKRIKGIENTISVFSLYIVLKPDTFKYENRNFYHFKDQSRVWDTHDYTEENWPESYMISMGLKKNMKEYAENLTIMVYMDYEEVEEWEDTFNTVAHKKDRGESYEQFKARKTEAVLMEVTKKFPHLRECIQECYSSTPLSFRDYIGCHRGGAYGYVKDVSQPLMSFVAPKTKVDNLLLTGQCLNMHGILGVTISAALACSVVLGAEYLLQRIQDANAEILVENRNDE